MWARQPYADNLEFNIILLKVLKARAMFPAVQLANIGLYFASPVAGPTKIFAVSGKNPDHHWIW
jgi:5-deoxy-D-glucuronate isomerase